MANQPKKYKKFVATAATATLVASAIVPVASAATPSFSDIAGNDHEANIKTAAELGLISGYADGTFGPNNHVTRGQVAMILSNWAQKDGGKTVPADYKEVQRFEDVELTADDKLLQSAALVFDNEIFTGSNGNLLPADNITRHHMALVLNTAYKAVTGTSLVELAGDTSEVVVGDISHLSAEHQGVIKALKKLGITVGDNFNPSNKVTRGQFASFLVKTVQAKAPVNELKVESVSAVNLLQTEVTFNTSNGLDKEKVENKDNYTFKKANGETVAVKSVTLKDNKALITFEDAVDNQTTLQLTIDEAVTGTEYTKDSVYYFDTTIPEVLGAEVVGNATIKVKFSEPIDFGELEDGLAGDAVVNAFEVNGGAYYIKSVRPLNNGTEANIELYSSIAKETSVKLAVDNSLEDYAGFNVISTEFKVDVNADTEAPKVVSYKDATPNGVTLVFDGDIKLEDGVAVADFYHTNSNNTVDVDGFEIVNGNELKLAFTGNKLPQGTAYVYIDGKTVSDLWDNVNDNQIRVEVKVTVDTEKPLVKELKVVTEEQITVKFNENVTAEKKNFTVLDKDGKVVDVIRSVSHDEDTTTINFNKKLSGDYSLVIEGVKDLANNAIEKVTTPFTVKDLTNPVISEFEATLYNADSDVQRLVINFKEAMAVEGKYSVVDLEKYVLDGTSLASVKGAKIVAVDNNTKVEITIPANEAKGGLDLDKEADYDLSIARVADAAGNFTAELADTITVGDAGYVTISKVEAVDTKTIKVTFSSLFTTFKASDLEVQNSENAKQSVAGLTTSVDKDGNTVVTITLASAMKYNAVTSADKALKLVVVGEGSSNKYGETLETGAEEAVVDAIAPELLKEAGKFVVSQVDGEDQIELTFTEDIAQLDNDTKLALAATDFIITDASNKTLVAGRDFTLVDEDADNKLVIEFTGDYADYEGTITISTKEKVTYIKDTAATGNAVKAFSGVEVAFDGSED